MRSFGQWRFTCNEQATREAYALAGRSGSESCSCIWCRNFLAVRDAVYPAAFIELLTSLGIDPMKEAEVWHRGRHSAGRHLYGGWFHFVGTLHETSDAPMVMVDVSEDFYAWLSRNPALSALDSLDALPLPLVVLEWESDCVPWVLPEDELE